MATRQFRDHLSVQLTLTVCGKQIKVAPGDVKLVELDLHTWGHEGRVEFFLADNAGKGSREKDKLHADWLKPDYGSVLLHIVSTHSDAAVKAKHTALEVAGAIVSKTLVEMPAQDGIGSPILFRRYGLHFVDVARHLWSQHFPTVLYTNKSLKQVVDANKGPKVTIAYDWDAVFGKSHLLLFLGLEPEKKASFYDYVIWRVKEHNGVFSYDYKKQSYKISAAKAAAGKPLKLRDEDLTDVEVEFPEVIRHEPIVLNSYANATVNKPVAQKQAVAGVRHDVLLTTPVRAEVDDEVKRQKAITLVRGPEVEVLWSQFPTTAVAPGALVEFGAKSRFATSGMPVAKKVYRVQRLRLRAEAVHLHADGDHLATDAEYLLELETRLELKDEKWVDLPACITPQWPRHVEAKVISDVGDKPHLTWKQFKDKKTSIDKHHVKVPLWSNQTVAVPFDANLFPGHFYFPPYKNERVLISLDSNRAWLKRYLDWREGARLPLETQGEHLLVGKTPKNGTSMKHHYEDNSPVFTLKRTNAKDTSTIRMKEGNLLILVKEEKK